MKPRKSFIGGVVLVAVAATLVVVLSPGERPASPSGTPEAPGSRSGVASSLAPLSEDPGGHRVSAKQSSGPDRRPMTERRRSWSVRPGDSGASSSDPRAAERVERYAHSRLEHLNGELDLDPGQQRRIFSLLARSAGSYDSSMRISFGGDDPDGNDTAGAGIDDPTGKLDPEQRQDRIAQELRPEQRSAWVERSIDDLLLWQEIINDLVVQLEGTAPNVSRPETGDPVDPPQPPASGGGRNLFDQ